MTAKQVMDKLKENGWTLDRVHGSHYVFKKDRAVRPVTVPFHGKRDMGPLAKVILKEAGIEEY